MRRAALAALTAPLALAALTACGATSDTKDETQPAVPTGVQKQYEVLADEVAENGQKVESGEWTVNLIAEAAEPWFEVDGPNDARFRAPKPGETHHIEIIPTETSTGRIVPDVPITLEVVDADGKVVQKMNMNFYYSTFYHYANNFTVPESGTYTLRTSLGVPTFNRHGEESETPALTEGATVEFTDVELTTE